MLFVHLAPLDVSIVAIYLVTTVVLGTWFARRQRDMTTYFVGNRSVNSGLVLISIVATETSTVTFLSVPGLAFNPIDGNLAFLQLAIGYLIGRCVIAWLLLPQYLNGELLTAYQLLRQKFNSTVQRTASAIFMITRTSADGMRLYLTALLLKQFAGWDITVSVLVMGIATLVYTYLGGIEAVIWTDVIQFAVYMIGAMIAAGFILGRLHGGWESYLHMGTAAGKFSLFDFTFDPKRPFTFWAGLIGGGLFTMASHGADQLMVQRYLCARSVRSAQVALIGSGMVVFVQFLLFLLIGVGLFVLWQQGLLALPEDVVKRGDEVFGYFIVRDLPSGVIGLLIAAVLAAAMSTLSASLNSLANASVNDFYRPLRPNQEERHYLHLSRVMTSLWGIGQISVALLAAAWLERSVIEMVLSIAGITTGLILGLFLLGRIPRPIGSTAALIGLLGGFLAVLVVWLPTMLGTPILAWPWFAPVGASTTVLVALVSDQLKRVWEPRSVS
jgi:SSS family transporter